MVVLQNFVVSMTANAKTNEIVKYVRQNILCEDNDYTPEKIRSRSKQTFTTYRPENEWKVVLQRRMEHRKSGFFSRQDEKYRECGKVELDSRNLVVNALKKVGNFSGTTEKSKWFKLSSAVRDEATMEKFNRLEKRSPRRRKSVHPVRIREIPVYRSKDIDNGMDAIRRTLTDAERRTVSVKGGHSLQAYVQKEREEQKRKKEETEADGNTIDMVMIDPLKEINVSMEGTADLAELHLDGPLRSPAKRSYLDMLDAIISILSITSNMRGRDLRSRQPLTVDMLRVLRHHKPHDSKPRTSSVNTRDSSNTAEKKREYVNNFARKCNRYRHRNSTLIPQVEYKAGTWEHFLTLGSPGQPEEIEENEPKPQNENKLVTIIKSLPINSTRRVVNPNRNIETPTPWFRDELKDTKEKDDNNDKIMTAAKHDALLDKLKSEFYDVQKIYSNEMEEEMSNRAEAYEVQLQSLELNHLREVALKRMRKRNSEVRQQILLKNAKPPTWYQILQDEVKTLRLNKDDEANRKMAKIAKFLEIKSVPMMKARLCLLFFSLPLYDLCTVPMQNAYLFISNKILEMPTSILADWLCQRKLNKLAVNLE